ncbi:MAG: 8-oxo-dGTP diphosphatase [Lachnospiraceae bacterium]|nr:8-oxo-dGTP diphosphatase [Lachnospiraceae bacterium]
MEITTLCYIENEGKYLMLNRNKKENDINEGKWIGVGGHFEEGETPNECIKREVLEETGLTLTSFRLRGILTFVQNKNFTEYIWLYTADGYKGQIKECNEGDLRWIDIEDLESVNLWEGDKVFLKLLKDREDFFSLKLEYEGDKLINTVLE